VKTLLLFYSGYLTEQLTYFILSTCPWSAYEFTDKSNPYSFILLLNSFIIVLVTCFMPKFFLTNVFGKITPYSTQQTFIFSWPTSTTTAELIDVPRQAKTLYK
jgi:hypothetical protein